MPRHDKFNKANDPLIKSEQEKKLKVYREQKKTELDKKKKEIDELFE